MVKECPLEKEQGEAISSSHSSGRYNEHNVAKLDVMQKNTH